MQTNDFQPYNIHQKWMPWRGKASNAMVVLINDADKYGQVCPRPRAQAPRSTGAGSPAHGRRHTPAWPHENRRLPRGDIVG